jgi:hypothetical protein
MSLKAFHIFFVSVSFLLALGVSFWAFRESSRTESSSYMILGVGAVVFAAALVWYGRWFLGKLKGVK